MQLPDELEQVGKGWHPILMRLHAELTAIEPDYHLGQVKEKYGRLCIYFDNPPPYHLIDGRLFDAVEEAEKESAHTCEFCGKPASLDTSRIWVKTICGECTQ